MSNILFVFEGAKTEKRIVDNLKKVYFESRVVITCAYCNNIYKLYQEIDQDQDLDLFSLLKEMPRNKDLQKFNRDNFGEIYLFFDYDGHDPLATDEKLTKMLKLFNEETKDGKLFVSYPMVEALKHIPKMNNFHSLIAPIKENGEYKGKVPQESFEKYQDYRKYDKYTWYFLVISHVQKANSVVNGCSNTLEKRITQDVLFIAQQEKYIYPTSSVAVLSAFPLFLYEYFGDRVLEIREYIKIRSWQ